MTPVQMMISSRSGLIRWTVLRETISREALPRLFFDAPVAGADLTVGFRLEAFDMVAVVIKARAEQMCEESVCAATKRCGHLHCAVSRGSVVAKGGEALPDIHPPPASRPTTPSRRRAGATGDRSGTAAADTGLAAR